MLPTAQRVVRLMQRPVGAVKPGVDLVLQQAAVLQGTLEKGDVVVRNLWLSLDPAMRGWMNDAKSYIEPVKLGDVMRGGCVSEVVVSNNVAFKPGQLVNGMFGWQEYAHVKGGKGVTPLPPLPPSLSPSAFLGPLGMNGLTAYFGFLDVGKPKAGDVVLVNGAAGATGSLVAQIAKNVVGCSVVCVAGGKEKCDWLRSLGFDNVVDYKATTNIYKAISQATPKGVDVFFDNVGGEQLDAGLVQINRGARVVICGAISQYNSARPVGPGAYLNLLKQRARMEGFVVFDFAARYGEALPKLMEWVSTGKLAHQEHVIKGLENAADGLSLLFSGGNKGKLVVQIAEPGAAAPASKL